jgi:hypothetical protein
MKRDHINQLKLFKGLPYSKLLFAMCILSDIEEVAKKVKDKWIQEHVKDVKELIVEHIEEDYPMKVEAQLRSGVNSK